MKEKLKVEYLTPYLPYKLNFMIEGVLCEFEGIDLHQKDTIISERVTYKFSQIKPILKPLIEFSLIPELLDEFSDAGLEAFENAFFGLRVRALSCMDTISYSQAKLMFKHHLDVFGLIDQGLAINYNDLIKK